MKTDNYENFFEEVLITTKCMDINKMEKYISETTSNDPYLIKRQLSKANTLLEENYQRYGSITEQDNIEAIKKGYYSSCQILLTLDEIRQKVAIFKIPKDSLRGKEIEKNWNNQTFLLINLLDLENMNLITYLRLLEERYQDVSNRNEAEQLKAKPIKKVGSHSKKEKDVELIQEKLPNSPKSDIITIEEVCEITKLSKSKIYHLACEHGIPHYKLDPKKKGRLFFLRPEIEAWLTKNRIGTVEEYLNQWDK